MIDCGPFAPISVLVVGDLPEGTHEDALNSSSGLVSDYSQKMRPFPVSFHPSSPKG